MTTTLANLADIARGDDFAFTVTHTADGDLTLAQVVATWRDQQDGIVFTRKNAAAGGDATQCAVTDGPNGVIAIYEVPSNTAGLLLSTYSTTRLRFDVQITTAAGAVKTIMMGYQTIIGDATR